MCHTRRIFCTSEDWWLNISSVVAVVGLESTIHQVSEDVGEVEVCAIVLSPLNECPIEFSFNISLSTEHKSAGNISYNNAVLLNMSFKDICSTLALDHSD